MRMKKKKSKFIVINVKNVFVEDSTRDVIKNFGGDKEAAMKYYNRSKRFYQYSEVAEVMY